jgi:hypothetical protein
MSRTFLNDLTTAQHLAQQQFSVRGSASITVLPLTRAALE